MKSVTILFLWSIEDVKVRTFKCLVAVVVVVASNDEGRMEAFGAVQN